MPTSLEELLKKKDLDPDFFNKPHKISLESPIEEHTRLAFDAFFSKRAPNHTGATATEAKEVKVADAEKSSVEIAKSIHGMQHACRVVIYAIVFVNLYRFFQHSPAKELTAEDVKLIQIALIFHDVARENEHEEDKWDGDSAILLYCYLTRVLKVDPAKAKVLAEAVNAKDQKIAPTKTVNSKSEKTALTEADILICEKIKSQTSQLSSEVKIAVIGMYIFQRNLEDRKKIQFMDYLFPEGWHSKEPENQTNVDKESKEHNGPHYSVLQQDSDGRFSWVVDHNREKNIFQKIIKDCDCLDIIRARDCFEIAYLDFFNEIAGTNFLANNVLIRLVREVKGFIHRQGDTVEFIRPDVKKQFEHRDGYSAILASLKQHAATYPILNTYLELLPADQLAASLPPQKLGKMRGLLDSQTVLARGEGAPSRIRKKQDDPTSLFTLSGVGYDIYKSLRRLGIKTRMGRINKNGHPHRSTSLIGRGGGIFASAGFLIVNPSMESIVYVGENDINSGFGRKDLKKGKIETMSPEKVPDELESLKLRLRMTSRNNATQSHNEVLCNITNFDMIYFSPDPNFTNSNVGRTPASTHVHSPLLQALFIQQEHLKATGRKLPIHEYSSVDDYISEEPVELSEAQIKDMWVEMCSSYIKKDVLGSFSQSVDKIKILAMYGTTFYHGSSIGPADACFSENFQRELNILIIARRKKNLLDGLRDNPQLFLSKEYFMFFVEHSDLLQDAKEILTSFVLDVVAKKATFSDLSSPRDLDVRSTISNFFIDITGMYDHDFKNIKSYWLGVSYHSYLKIYAYANFVKLDEAVVAIRTHATEMLATDLNARKSAADISSEKEWSEVDSLVKFAYAFNLEILFKDPLQARILASMMKLESLPWGRRAHIDIESHAQRFCGYLKQLYNIGIMSPPTVAAAKAIITNWLEQFSQAKKSDRYVYHSNNWITCFDAAQLVGIPFSQLKSTFFKWQAGTEKKFRGSVVYELTKIKLLDDYDIFTCVLNNLKNGKDILLSKFPEACVVRFQQEISAGFNQLLVEIRELSLEAQFIRLCEFILAYKNRKLPIAIPKEIKDHYLWMLEVPGVGSNEQVESINRYLNMGSNGSYSNQVTLFSPPIEEEKQVAPVRKKGRPVVVYGKSKN